MAPSRGCGGIGRRVRFRSWWAKARGGSSPSIRTTISRHIEGVDSVEDMRRAGAVPLSIILTLVVLGGACASSDPKDAFAQVAGAIAEGPDVAEPVEWPGSGRQAAVEWPGTFEIVEVKGDGSGAAPYLARARFDVVLVSESDAGELLRRPTVLQVRFTHGSDGWVVDGVTPHVGGAPVSAESEPPWKDILQARM